jgi:VPDSG-CTERM motif
MKMKNQTPLVTVPSQSLGMKALPKILLALTALAALSVAYPARANLISNPGFETGDFTDWTTSGGASVVGTFLSVSPHSGSFQAHITTGSITQTVVTMATQSYTISFWLAIPSGRTGDPFAVIWGGSTIFTEPAQPLSYSEFTFTETASSGSTALQFLVSSGVTNWLLDDVSVTPAGVGVPDTGSTLSLLGFASLGLVALRRKLRC